MGIGTMIVRESIEFQRGKDPKEVMGLGIEQQIENFLESVDQSTSNIDHKLKICARYGKTSFVEYLIKKGADPRAQADIALTMAINRNDADMAEALLKAGSKIDSRYISKHRRKKRSPEIRRLLSKYGMDLDESVNFERGKDPKKAMGIGIEAQYKRIRDRIAEEDLYRSYYKSVHEGIFKNIPYIIFQDTDRETNEPDGLSPFVGVYIMDDTIIDTCWASHIKETIKLVESKISQDLFSPQLSAYNESVSFERGKDPKETMNVGLRSQSLQIEGVYYRSGKSHNGKGKWRRISDEQADELLQNMDLKHVDAFAVKHFPEEYQNVTAYHSLATLKDSEYMERYKWILFNGKYYRIPRLSDPESEFFKNESVSFERGKDPKDAMDIGDKYARIESKILQAIESLIKEYGLDMGSINMTEDSQVDNSMITYEFDGRPRFLYYGDKKLKHTYYISYWFVEDVFFAGCIENQYLGTLQNEAKTIELAKKYLREFLEQNER
jgi:hypothetical protein